MHLQLLYTYLQLLYMYLQLLYSVCAGWGKLLIVGQARVWGKVRLVFIKPKCAHH